MKVYHVEMTQHMRNGIRYNSEEMDVRATSAKHAMSRAIWLARKEQWFQKSRPIEITSVKLTLQNVQ